MNSYTLKALTWGTVAAALISALLLAATDSSRPDSDNAQHAGPGRPSSAYTADAKVKARVRANVGPSAQAGASTSDSP